MSENRISQVIREFLKESSTNIVEERMAEYIVRGIRGGRNISDILNDTYIRNRLDGVHLEHLLENKAILEEFEAQLRETFEDYMNKE